MVHVDEQLVSGWVLVDPLTVMAILVVDGDMYLGFRVFWFVLVIFGTVSWIDSVAVGPVKWVIGGTCGSVFELEFTPQAVSMVLIAINGAQRIMQSTLYMRHYLSGVRYDCFGRLVCELGDKKVEPREAARSYVSEGLRYCLVDCRDKRGRDDRIGDGSAVVVCDDYRAGAGSDLRKREAR